MKICLLNETKSFLFLLFHKLIPYFIFLQQEKSEHIFLCMFLRKQEYMFQTLRGKQKYQVTNVGVEKIKLSRLLVQRINECKMNEIQRKTPR